MAEADSFPIIHVDPVAPEAHRLWAMTLELAEALGTERQWSLIGGLLSYVEDPRALAKDEELKSSEKRWLLDVEGLLGFSDADLGAQFPAAVLERAQQAFRLLCA
jgi:hypothetical protein